MKLTPLILAVGGAVAWAVPGAAQSLYVAKTTFTDPLQGTITTTASFSSPQDLFNYYSNASVRQVLPSFYAAYLNGSDSLSGTVNYLGAQGTISAPPVANGVANIYISIPGAGITITGTGATRGDALADIKHQILSQSSTLYNELQTYLAKASPLSPLAGNPQSLETALTDGIFGFSAFETMYNASSIDMTNGPTNRFGISVSAGEFSSGGFNGTDYSIPISFAHQFTKSGLELEVSLPLTYERLGTASSYSGQASVGLQIPVYRGTDWYITPIVSAGVAASANFGAAGAMYSYTLTSRYTWHATSRLDLTLGDMAGEIQTLGVKVANHNIDPKVTDSVFKNGIMAEYTTPYHLWGEPFSVRSGYAITDYRGTQLYLNDYSEVFFDMGAATNATGPAYKLIRLSIQATIGRHYSAINGGLGYTF